MYHVVLVHVYNIAGYIVYFLLVSLILLFVNKFCCQSNNGGNMQQRQGNIEKVGGNKWGGNQETILVIMENFITITILSPFPKELH